MKTGCALLVFLSTAVLGQAPAEQKLAVVEGKVINSVSGAAIRKAELTLTTDLMPEGFADMAARFGLGDDAAGPGSKPKEPKRSFSATSDAAGKFHFDGIAPGDYFLTVKHVGFVDLTYKPAGPMRASEGMLRLKPGQELHDLELQLVPQGAVAGKVIDEDGDPVPDAMVIAESASYSSGRRKMQIRDSSTTSDRGEFRLGKLPPGRFYISAEVLSTNPMGEGPAPPKDGVPETGYVATYFPKTTDCALAEAVEVRAGADVPGLTIQLQKSRVVRVKGKVAGSDGKPLKGAQVMLMSGSRPGSMRMTMAMDAEGRFELANVAPGAYTAMIMQVQDQKMIQQPLIVPNENLVDVKLGAMTEGSLGGRVIVTGESKVALKGLEISLVSDEAPVMPASARVDETGAFVLRKLLGTTYELNVADVPEGAYLKSVLWNGKEKLGAPFDFTGGVSGDLQAFLGTDGGTLDVRVSREDKPVSDATVVLLRDDASQRNPETTRSGETDELGHVAIKDVPPGNYLAFAWEEVEDGSWFDPVFLRAAIGDAVRVTVNPKDKQRLDLKAIPAGK